MEARIILIAIILILSYGCSSRWENVEPRLMDELNQCLGTNYDVDSLKIVYYEASGFNSIHGDFYEHAVWKAGKYEMSRLFNAIDTSGYSIQHIEYKSKKSPVYKKSIDKAGLKYQISIEPAPGRIHLYIYKI